MWSLLAFSTMTVTGSAMFFVKRTERLPKSAFAASLATRPSVRSVASIVMVVGSGRVFVVITKICLLDERDIRKLARVVAAAKRTLHDAGVAAFALRVAR